MDNNPQIEIGDREILLKLADADQGKISHNINVVLDKSDFGALGFEVIGLKEQLKLPTIVINDFENDRIRVGYSSQDDALSVKFKFIKDRYVTSEEKKGEVTVSGSNQICSFRIPLE